METRYRASQRNPFPLENSMRASELMTSNPYCVNARTPVSHIMRAMVEREISAVMVVSDDGTLIGLVSEGDRSPAGQRPPEEARALAGAVSRGRSPES